MGPRALDYFREFIQGQDDEMPFPAYNLSVGEIACMIDKCENLGLICRQVGTVSTETILISEIKGHYSGDKEN